MSQSQNTTIDTILSLTENLSVFAKTADKLREDLIMLLPSKKNSYIQMLKESIEAQKEIREGKGERFNSIEDLIKDLQSR